MDFRALTLRFLQKLHAVLDRTYDKRVLDFFCFCCRTSLFVFARVVIGITREGVLLALCWVICSSPLVLGEVLAYKIDGDALLVLYWGSLWYIS